MLGRYEENAYLARMMKVVGHEHTRLLELQGYDHGMTYPAFPLIIKMKLIRYCKSRLVNFPFKPNKKHVAAYSIFKVKSNILLTIILIHYNMQTIYNRFTKLHYLVNFVRKHLISKCKHNVYRKSN